jgi:hypothetical protein
MNVDELGWGFEVRRDGESEMKRTEMDALGLMKYRYQITKRRASTCHLQAMPSSLVNLLLIVAERRRVSMYAGRNS